MARKIQLCYWLLTFLSGLPSAAQQPLLDGMWHCELKLTTEATLPFYMEVTSNGREIQLVNGKEKILVQDYIRKGDSIIITPSFFQTEIRAVIIKARTMQGQWIDYSRATKYVIPFTAQLRQEDRFNLNQKPVADFTGKWEVHFSPDTKDSSSAIGIFAQENNKASGTFLTTTGDDRFLDGNIAGDSLYLSAFDGAHAFLFKAVMLPNHTIQGMYWSGNHWSEPWVAKRNDDFDLPETEKLTYLKEGIKTVAFTFPDATNKPVSLTDPMFKNKVVLIELMGSWCPNCMDETKFLVPFYNASHKAGLEIVALDYERKNEPAFVQKTLQHLKSAYNIPYNILFAGLTKDASSSLPMLNKVMGYPTLIAVDRKGNVRWIETGINGPATGTLYNKWCDQISNRVGSLLQEK